MRSTIFAGLLPFASAGVLTRHHTTTTTVIEQLAEATSVLPVISKPTASVAKPGKPSIAAGSYEMDGPNVIKDTEKNHKHFELVAAGMDSATEDAEETAIYVMHTFFYGPIESEDISEPAERSEQAENTPFPLRVVNQKKDIFAPTFSHGSESDTAIFEMDGGNVYTATAPVNDELYLRLIKPKHTEYFTVFFTTNKHKNHLDMYHNAKISGARDFELSHGLAQNKNEKAHYTLHNNDDAGSFYWCPMPAKMFPDVQDSLLYTDKPKSLPSAKCIPVDLEAFWLNK